MTAQTLSGGGWSRGVVLAVLGLLILIVLFQVRYPSQAWRELALIAMVAPALILVIAGLVASPRGRQRSVGLDSRDLVLLGGALALATGITVRTALAGWPSTGMDSAITHQLGIGVFIAAFLLARRGRLGAVRLTGRFLMVGAVACGIYALMQRTVLYPSLLAELEQSLGSTRDPIELGVLHHLRLGRVASFWGDPNLSALACCLGIAPCVVALVGWDRSSPFWRLVGGLGLLCAGLGVVLSGSRGGVLDGTAVLALLALYGWLRRGGKGALSPIGGHAVAALTLLLMMCLPSVGHTDAPTTTSPMSAPVGAGLWGALQRNDTIRERIHYLSVGGRIVSEHPWLGDGPGTVERNWGRLKPEEAREARFLHNWPTMVAAEYGLPAAGVFVLLLLVALGRTVGRVRRMPAATVAVALSAGVFWLDGLYQLSFNHREMVQVAGLLAGVTLGSLSPVGGLRSERSRLAVIWMLVVGIIVIAVVPVQIPRALFDADLARARLALAQGDAERALIHARRAEARYPGDAAPKQLLAAIRTEQGALDLALEHLALAARTEPWRVSIALQRADLLLRMGQPAAAESVLVAALAYYPTSSRLLRKLAEARAAAGDIPGALNAAEQAVRHGYLDIDSDRAYLDALRARHPEADSSPRIIPTPQP